MVEMVRVRVRVVGASGVCKFYHQRMITARHDVCLIQFFNGRFTCCPFLELHKGASSWLLAHHIHILNVAKFTKQFCNVSIRAISRDLCRKKNREREEMS